ncbi:aldose 1-epimerase [Mycobacterium sp. MYCO198283]|uniref:aldose 1-epimerase n=1 Tax=Mycobacterium sp. MYCO198283 TaxID=2883505 RepID=UPI001E648280|nr:aldose 1-epimerase [Mycobacterium sp. MYCO198283]MCG5432131.1 aldose 1-epimerase [Mycobacterium sp. MYCO198283]
MQTVTLRDAASALAATFVPEAGMVGVSLADDGVELLGQRRGLDAYRRAGKTMGLPILYPWANRLSGPTYSVGDTDVTVSTDSPRVRADEHGLPIHGTLSAYPGWRLGDVGADTLTASCDFGADPDLLATFPFPHLLAVAVSLADRTLTVTTTVTPTGDAAVPICYGYHPYLTLPGAARTEWCIELPAMRHQLADGLGIPTGEWVPSSAAVRPLGTRAWDDGFTGVPEAATFAVTGGGRRIEVVFDRGFPATQVFAPTSEDVVCFEPMTAPTDALRRGGYRLAEPGEPDVTRFSIRIAD